MDFVHLHVHTPYSFLDGATDIEPLVRHAASMGMKALAMTDHNSTAGAVKFVTACRAYGLRPILGAEITMEDATHLTLIARHRRGYANLCRLLTYAHAHGGRLNPMLPWAALGIPRRPDCGKPRAREPLAPPACDLEGLICLTGCRRGLLPSLVRSHRYEEAMEFARLLLAVFGPASLWFELQDDLTPDCDRTNHALAELAQHMGVGAAATNNVHHATREEFIGHDVLRCIAAKTTLSQPHPERPLNAERYLKSPAEMHALFAWLPGAVESTLRIAERCEAALPEGEEITPAYPVPPRFLEGLRAAQAQEEASAPSPAADGAKEVSPAGAYLRHLTYKGARARYREITPRVEQRLEMELSIICQLGFADYFLMVWDIVRWARKQGIRCTGRGSAADSCVAYCLYLTDVDVIRRNLPFARFLVPGKTPDIDMDFPSERRDEVFQYIVERYGADHVGMVCTFHTFWARSAVRDIGKVLELPAEALKFFSANLHHSVRAGSIAQAFERHPELRPYLHLRERFQLLFALCGRIAGFPRHIGTHSSGIVISRVPLAELAPLQPSARGLTRIWTLDKDDAEVVGAIKFDVLSLGILSVIGDSERNIREITEERSRETHEKAAPPRRFSYDRIPLDDPSTYRMFRAGAAVGTFQFESAAQMNLAVLLEPEHFEDLVASVALIRPGPIRGNVVSRFVACRNGWARADVLHPALRETLAKTYGCIVFQEQVNDVVAVMTGCTEAEADKFRKSLTRRAKLDSMDDAREEFVRKAMARHPDLDHERAHALFDQIEGWSGYGFTEGHAASFALTGYRTGYLSVHHTAPYFAGMMNHQPMGYYTTNTLAGEARRRGVRILPVDINSSQDKSFAPDSASIRLGLRIVAELREEDIAAILQARAAEPFTSLLDFCARVPLHRNCLENLLLCGAFDLLHEHRRGALWKLDETIAMALAARAAQTAGRLDLGGVRAMRTPIAWEIEDFSPWEKFLWTWRITGVGADCHAFAYLRDSLRRYGVLPVYEALRARGGTRVTVAGMNVRPHRPPTRSGEPVLFTLIEDETGLLQTTVAGEAIAECTGTFVSSPVVLVRGTIQKRGQGVVLLAERAKPLIMSQFARQAEALDQGHVPDSPEMRVRVAHRTETLRR